MGVQQHTTETPYANHKAFEYSLLALVKGTTEYFDAGVAAG